MTPDRFFSLMLLLASKDAVTTQELASALGVSLRTVTRDLNWLREAGLPVTAQRGRLGGVTMLPGAGLDLTRLTPGERDLLSLTGLDEKQRGELNASVETWRALSKIAAAQPRRIDELLPLTDVVHVDSRPWRQPRASGTTPRPDPFESVHPWQPVTVGDEVPDAGLGEQPVGIHDQVART